MLQIRNIAYEPFKLIKIEDVSFVFISQQTVGVNNKHTQY